MTSAGSQSKAVTDLEWETRSLDSGSKGIFQPLQPSWQLLLLCICFRKQKLALFSESSRLSTWLISDPFWKCSWLKNKTKNKTKQKSLYFFACFRPLIKQWGLPDPGASINHKSLKLISNLYLDRRRYFSSSISSCLFMICDILVFWLKYSFQHC